MDDEESFNPPGSTGDPLPSVEAGIEAAACVALARWVTQNRPAMLAVEIDGEGYELSYVNVLEVNGLEPRFRSVEMGDDPALWLAAQESWELLASAGRGEHHVIQASEAGQWRRGS